MLYVGLDVSGKSLVVSAVNERKRCVYEGPAAPGTQVSVDDATVCPSLPGELT